MQAIDRIARLFETFAPADVDRLADWYTEDAHFRDPFSDVKGIARIRTIYHHLFEALDSPRFAVLQRSQTGDQCFLLWDFSFGLRGQVRVIRGVSHLRLAADGRIAEHRDYWDAAELYECFPALGTLMRWLRRRASPPGLSA